uniref:Uncharacterized protein n=1 Tax=Arion vulgaris TaxID=1028688 RepID=A0A0B7AYI1_9EUPU
MQGYIIADKLNKQGLKNKYKLGVNFRIAVTFCNTPHRLTQKILTFLVAMTVYGNRD